MNRMNKKLGFLLVLAILLGSATAAHAFPWNFDMWIQPSILPYQEPVAYPQLSVTTQGLRIKPQPREDFENIARSPIPATEESLANGKKMYETFCYVCHGTQGHGDGPVIKRGFYPLNLTTPGVIARTDGYIYAYIRYGGKVMMPSYRESINSESAWDIVNYVRKLQGDLEPPAETPAQDSETADTTDAADTTNEVNESPDQPDTAEDGQAGGDNNAEESTE